MDSENNFFEKVYKVVLQIPWGKVTTYGAIAKHIGSAQSSRMVGWALNKAFSKEYFIPAHRVVNRKGLLTGKNHFGGTNTMKELLESEGIKFNENQIINLEQYFWDPNIELF